MFDEIMAVDIGSSYIKLLVGNKYKISNSSMIKTPEGSISDGKIINIDLIYQAINQVIIKQKIKTKFISFIIHGQDTIVRHTESPIMNEDALRKSVQYEIGQYLPQGGDTHYIDYKIIDKINKDKKKIYKLLVVATPREKVDMYVELSKKLKMKIKYIDISANCVSRVFSDLCKNANDINSIGIIDIGSKSSSLIILENGKLFIEREVAFGINSVVREVSRKFDMELDKAYKYFM